MKGSARLYIIYVNSDYLFLYKIGPLRDHMGTPSQFCFPYQFNF